MTALLTDNLPLLAGAPNGIQKLRELILELAVRGKLVPQDPSDEPASELLKRIAEAKARLVAEGKIKKQKPLTEIGEDEKPFELPESWTWGRLGELALKITDGTHHSPTNTQSGDYKYISAKNIKSWGIDLNEITYVTSEVHQEIFSRCDPSKGDILYIKDGATTGIATINSLDEAFSMLSSVALLKPSIWLHNEYFLKAMISPFFYREMRAGMTGVAITRVTLAKLNNAIIPLPPLAEQHRIVAKVDELMALCDRLEARHADAVSAHTRLVQSLLDSLTQASDAEDFAASWHRLAEHFHSLFTSEFSIDALKQTLLQLAVMGKLVPQDSNDEPASELLKRIINEKGQLIAEGQVKKQQPLTKFAEEKKPFTLPEEWEWCHVSDLMNIKHGYAFSSSYFCDSVASFVLTTPGNFFEVGGFRDRGDRTKYYFGPVAEEFVLNSGDLIVAMTEQAAGLLGSAAFVPNDGKVYLHNQRLGKLIFNCDLISSEYLFYYFNGPFLRACIASSSTGMKVKHTSPGKIGIVFFPLPPLAEQHRIVAKLDQLMALCDQLKARLTAARQLHERLAGALVEQAVA